MYKPSKNSQVNRLNDIALRTAKLIDDSFFPLSTGEKCYVALASNRVDLLESMGYTIPEAISRIESDFLADLIECWRYAGNPSKYE